MTIDDLISRYLDGELSSEEEAELHHRLSLSPEARSAFRSQVALHALARDSRTLLEPSAALSGALFSRLEQEEGLQPIVASAATATAAASTSAPIGEPAPRAVAGRASRTGGGRSFAADRPAEERRRRRIAGWVAVPLLLIAAFVVGDGILSQRGSESSSDRSAPVLADAGQDRQGAPAPPPSTVSPEATEREQDAASPSQPELLADASPVLGSRGDAAGSGRSDAMRSGSLAAQAPARAASRMRAPRLESFETIESDGSRIAATTEGGGHDDIAAVMSAESSDALGASGELASGESDPLAYSNARGASAVSVPLPPARVPSTQLERSGSERDRLAAHLRSGRESMDSAMQPQLLGEVPAEEHPMAQLSVQSEPPAAPTQEQVLVQSAPRRREPTDAESPLDPTVPTPSIVLGLRQSTFAAVTGERNQPMLGGSLRIERPLGRRDGLVAELGLAAYPEEQLFLTAGESGMTSGLEPFVIVGYSRSLFPRDQRGIGFVAQILAGSGTRYARGEARFDMTHRLGRQTIISLGPVLQYLRALGAIERPGESSDEVLRIDRDQVRVGLVLGVGVEF